MGRASIVSETQEIDDALFRMGLDFVEQILFRVADDCLGTGPALQRVLTDDIWTTAVEVSYRSESRMVHLSFAQVEHRPGELVREFTIAVTD